MKYCMWFKINDVWHLYEFASERSRALVYRNDKRARHKYTASIAVDVIKPNTGIVFSSDTVRKGKEKIEKEMIKCGWKIIKNKNLLNFL